MILWYLVFCRIICCFDLCEIVCVRNQIKLLFDFFPLTWVSKCLCRYNPLRALLTTSLLDRATLYRTNPLQGILGTNHLSSLSLLHTQHFSHYSQEPSIIYYFVKEKTMCYVFVGGDWGAGILFMLEEVVKRSMKPEPCSWG